jgi:spore coat polysaccharide biosynthesis protein SpsF (cytidylyltransferase family)
MLNTLGVVEVRPGIDTPRLTACRRLGGKSLLEWVVRRMTESQRLDGVLVLAPEIAQTPELAELVPCDVPFVASDRPDALARFAAVLAERPAKAIVRVVADHPFVDPVLVDRLVTTAAQHSQSDCIGYCSRSGMPAVQSPLGVIGEWISTAALERAHKEATKPALRDQVTGFFYAHPERFNLRLIPVPRELDRDDVRLRIDGEEDWEHTQTIFEALGPEHLDYHRVAHLLDHQPALRQRMAALNGVA